MIKEKLTHNENKRRGKNMKKHVFIINPTSGKGKYRDILFLIEENFYGSELNVEIRKTEYPGHATEIAKEYDGNFVLYSVGGDGTAHEILNGINPSVEMAIIPVGTGNDFWRMVDFSGSLKDILYETVQGEVTEIDFGLMNGHRFLNTVAVGFDAQVNKVVNSTPKHILPKNLVYIVTALKELARYKAMEIELELDGEKSNHNILLSSFMNGKWYGGGVKTAPKARVSDRLLDVCIVEDMSLFKILRAIPKYIKGTHLDLDEVSYKQVSNIKIKSKEKITVASDGELFEYKNVEIKLDPNRLKLRLPKSATLRH